MKCQSCGRGKLEVVDSRPSSSGLPVRRRRVCRRCKAEFWTLEDHEVLGRRELKALQRILSGIQKVADGIQDVARRIDALYTERPQFEAAPRRKRKEKKPGRGPRVRKLAG